MNAHTRFPEKDRPLRRDVTEVGALLGDVLQEQGPDGLFEAVERVRVASRRWRKGDASAEGEVRETLRALDSACSHELVRAFSAWFALVNMAEKVHRVRRAADYARAGAPQPGSLRDVVHRLRTRGVPISDVISAVESLHLEPVFTAHPTEAVRRTLLEKEQRIGDALIARMERASPGESDAAMERIREEITLGLQTDERRDERPTVADEVEHVTWFVTRVLYRVLPRFHEALEEAVREEYGAAAAKDLPLAQVRFGSWVGGDMDGNPNVGADTIRATLDRHQELIVRLYEADVRSLFDHLSQSDGRVGVSDDVRQRLSEWDEACPEVRDAIPARYSAMPYRRLCWHMHAALQATRERREGAYDAPESLRRDLELLEASLLTHRGAHAGARRVRELSQRVRAFGFHLAALDVRQDSLVHRRAAGELLGDSEFVERSTDERAAALDAALASGNVPSHDAAWSDETAKTLDVFRAIADARRTHGTSVIGWCIISMAQDVDDVLAVLWLARCAGLVEPGGEVPLDVAPLFETVGDLQHAPSVLASLLSNARARAHLTARGMRQPVMLGYSDSNKDGGITASRWALEQSQVRLIEVASEAGVALSFFHGRGGSISRGGGKPRDAILAAPAGAVRGHLRMTEQGEIIHGKYGLQPIARRTLELLGGAVLERVGRSQESIADAAGSAEVFETLATESRQAYRALVYDDARFFGYFQAATPIDVIERLKIGSRPSKRRAGQGIQDLRAIPWVFAWTQSRHLLTGWYGVGAGLVAARERYGLETLRDLGRRSPFFATLLADVEMVLAKADLDIAARYAELAGTEGAPLFQCIREEYERTCSAVCEVREQAELLERDPMLRRTIALRNPYIDPMSFAQIDLLQRWRAAGRDDPELESILVATVRGVARGLLNTG